MADDGRVHEAVARADLIISIGHDTVEKPPFLMKIAGGPKVTHLGYQSATVEPVYHPSIQVIGDIGTAVDALGDRLEGKLEPDEGMLA